MRLLNLTLVLVCLFMALPWVSLSGRAQQAGPPPLQLLDMTDANLLGNATGSEGVRSRLVADPDHPGQNLLEVKVESFSKHKNSYPTLAFDATHFVRPLNLSGYSRVAATIEYLGEGYQRPIIYIATLPYNDRGINIEEGLINIKGGDTQTGGFNLNELARNDASAIQYLSFRFPAIEKEATYRIHAVRAEYDVAAGSPAGSVQREARQLSNNLALAGKAQTSAAARAEVAALTTVLSDLAKQAGDISSADQRGKLPALTGALDAAAQRIGWLRMGGKDDFIAWTGDPYRNFTATEGPRGDSEPLTSLRVDMAGNECRDLVFQVGAPGKDVRLQVTAAPGKGLPEGMILTQETRYLFNRGGQATGDVVVPLNGTLLIPKGESRQIRLRFDTQGYSVPPGNHPFSVMLKNEDSGLTKSIPGTVHVRAFDLPGSDRLPLHSYIEFDKSEFKSAAAVRNAVADMKKFGMNIVCLHPNEMPRPGRLGEGDRVEDWDDTEFLKRITLIQGAWNAAPGTNKLTIGLSVSGMYDLGLKDRGIDFLSPRWRPIFAQYLQHLNQLMSEAGVPRGEWLLSVGDEADEMALLQRELPMVETVKSLEPSIKLYSNASHIINDEEASRRYFDTFDIFQPDLFYGVKANPYLLPWIMKNASARNKPVWTYQCLGDFAQLNKNVYGYYRVYAWEALQAGFTGMGVWTYCSQAMQQEGISFVMVYNRNDKPMHARRYEILREGMNDFLYVQLLRDVAGRKSAADKAKAEELIGAAIAEITAQPRDTSLCDKWRLRIADEIEAMNQPVRRAAM